MPRHTPILTSPAPRRTPLASSGPEPKGTRKPGQFLRWILLMATVGLLIFGIRNAYSGLSQSDLFVLEEISVSGSKLLRPDEVVWLAGLRKGGNLFEADLQDAVNRLQSHPLIRETLLLRKPPVGLMISIREREPLALVSHADDGMLGLDREGTLFDLPAVPLDLPVVTATDAARDSSGALQLSDLGRFLERVKTSSPELLEEISEIRLREDAELRVVLSRPGPSLHMRLGNAAHQCANYLAYRDGARMDWTADYIDLRFENQVVVGRRENLGRTVR